MKIVIFESDRMQSATLIKELTEQFPDAEITTINTEVEFRQALDESRLPDAKIYILDLMGRWADPSPRMPEMPEDVIMGGYMQTGVRLYNLLRQKEVPAPVIFWSSLIGFPNFNLPKNVQKDPRAFAVPKFVGQLIPTIRSVCN